MARVTRNGVDELSERLIGALASAGEAEPDAARIALGEIGEWLGAQLGVLWFLDEGQNLLRWQADWAPADAPHELRGVTRRLTFAPGVGLPGRVLESLEPAWISEIAEDPRFPRAAVALRDGLRSVVGAPLVTPHERLGVIEFFRLQPHVPDDAELEALSLAARQLAAYLGRLRVEERLRATEESTASIFQAALDCIVTMDHRGVVLDFNPAAEATFGYPREQAVGRLLADLIIPPELREAHRRALERYLRDRRPRIIDRRLELKALRADGSTFPVELTVTRLGEREPPTFAGFLRDIGDRTRLEHEQSQLLYDALTARAHAEAAGTRAEIARQEAERALNEAERARARMALLAQAGRMMAASIDWESTLEAVVRSAVPAVADWCCLSIVNASGELQIAAIAHADPGCEEAARQLAARYPPPAGAERGETWVVRTGRAEVEQDLGEAELRAMARDDAHLRLLQTLGMRHRVIAPLAGPSGVVGTLTFVLRDAARPFAPEDVELATSLASRAALHVQNARLYTERSHIAQTLQASLRPRPLPEIPGAEIAAAFRPVGTYNEVGGDFYDVYPSGEGVWTAIVGDVSGKGPEAAAVTALARHTLRAGSMLEDRPAANLALLNRVMCEGPGAGRFCTVLYARLCPGPEHLEVRFANGGHPPPLLLRSDGTVEALETGRGPLVGALPRARFGEARISLEPGDLLLLYTDGVTEVRPSDVALGERELVATLSGHAGRPSADIVEAVAQRAVDLQVGQPRDDIAVVAVRACP